MDVAQNAQELDNTDYDDAFYAELERRILTLIDDNDHSEFSSVTQKYYTSSSLTTVKQTSNYFYWNNGGCDSVPAPVLNLWGSTNKGTGVFIPRVASSRSRNKQRRKSKKIGIVNKNVGS